METVKSCFSCNISLLARHKKKFCSNKCQMNYQHLKWVRAWKGGEVNGNIGITVRNFSKHLRMYLIDKFKNKCSICGWNEKHPITGVAPLEVDHIDGNSENNLESNLRLICPNCHSLTPFYKNLNKGKGRKWRMNKYIKNS